MRINKKMYGLFAVAKMLMSSSVIAARLLTITPMDYSYHNPAAAMGTTLTIQYQITNNTSVTLGDVSASHLPAGMTSSHCSALSANGGTCVLTITIPASMTKSPRTIYSQFKVCAQKHTAGCTLVDLANEINVTVVNANTFLTITDIHLKDGVTTPITYGQDTGDTLWASTRSEVSTLIAEQVPKFVILLGDLPAHHDQTHLEQNIGAVLTGLSGLSSINNNHLPVFYVYGNNDSLVVDYGPFFNGTTNLFSLDPAHNSPASKGWPALNADPDCSVSSGAACTYTTTSPMPPQHADDMAYAQSRGYYSAYPLGTAAKLRLISVNSVIFSYEYYLSGAAQLAVAQQEFDWLSAQLAAASANNESVYIAMHIPVGTDAFNHGNDMWNDTLILSNGLKFRDAFLALVEQYKSNIRTVISAHTHLDEFRALYDNTALSNYMVLDVGVPGITPQHFNNPGMQIYLYDNTYQLVEQKTYYTTPNPGVWISYSYLHDYACPSGSTMFLCSSSQILAQLPGWKLQPQPIMNNPYETNYSVRVPTYDPTGITSWLQILNTIQVIPT